MAGRRTAWVRRAVVAATSLALLAACTTTPPPPAPDSGPDVDHGAPGTPMSWIHVARAPGRRPFLADARGREVILRGANTTGVYLNHEEDDYTPGVVHKTTDPADYNGRCPANDNRWVNPPFCQVDAGKGPWTSSADDSLNDLSQMRALGFNVMRLVINWAQVEPEPGRYDAQFVARVEQIVGWAEEQGIYTLVDFHQDHYGDLDRNHQGEQPPTSTRAGGQADGAPRWAAMTDGIANVNQLGQDSFNAAQRRAFQHFWQNDVPPVSQGDAPGPGLQDHLIGAMAAVMRPLVGRSSVVGIELMNEPVVGEADPVAFAEQQLYPFYRRAIEALTGVRDGLPTCPAGRPSSMDLTCAYPSMGLDDRRHMVFFEPNAMRNLLDASIQPNVPFSEYRNLVFAPHVYTHIFTLDSVLLHQPHDQATFPPDYDYAYRTADTEARSMDTAVLVTEFGGNETEAPTLTEGTLAAQERYAVGAMVWTWKDNCGLEPRCSGGTGHPDPSYMWSMWETGGAGPSPAQNGPALPLRTRHVARITPRWIAGTVQAYSFVVATGRFEMTVDSITPVTVGDRSGETLVVVPPIVTGGMPSVGGAAVLDEVVTNPDGSRWVWVAPTGAGHYSVMVTPSP